MVDFHFIEKDEEKWELHAMRHHLLHPKKKVLLIKEKPESARANAYDLAINGVEVGGGSIRIHDRELQETVFSALGFSKEEAEAQFGFLLSAFEYGAPPHGGIAFGFDRLCSLFSNRTTIETLLPFSKITAGEPQ